MRAALLGGWRVVLALALALGLGLVSGAGAALAAGGTVAAGGQVAEMERAGAVPSQAGTATARAGVTGSQATAAGAAIDACLRRLDPDFDVGYERIASRCPDLSRRLQESGWSAWLPRDWQQPGNSLSPGSLIELRVLVERELATRSSQQKPEVAHLRPLLAGLRGDEPEREGWWGRLKAWMREVFERRAPTDEDSDLSRLVAAMGMSQTVIELVSYGALGIVVALAVLIVSNELRAAGVLPRPARRAVGRASGGVRGREAAQAPSWGDIEGVELQRRPALLLEAIVGRLAEQDRFLLSRGLTVRELIRAARLLDDSNRERLARLAGIVEALRFSAVPVPADDIAGALKNGRELLDRLGPAPA
jgi:hypothetical protein